MERRLQQRGSVLNHSVSQSLTALPPCCRLSLTDLSRCLVHLSTFVRFLTVLASFLSFACNTRPPTSLMQFFVQPLLAAVTVRCDKPL